MARLEKGENQHIDNINDLVEIAKSDDKDRSSDSLGTLLDLFKPMILGLCKRWSTYFNDDGHRLISLNELLGECTYWFGYYTIYKYTIDGSATYNKFIKDHMSQRIRYIYECEMKYHSKLIFPDPHKEQVDDNSIFDQVVVKYSSHNCNELESDMINEHEQSSKSRLALRIIELMNCDLFNDREREIFIEVRCYGKTHEQMGKKFEISRTRVTQILARVTDKLYKRIEDDAIIWQLLDDADIDITNERLR